MARGETWVHLTRPRIPYLDAMRWFQGLEEPGAAKEELTLDSPSRASTSTRSTLGMSLARSLGYDLVVQEGMRRRVPTRGAERQ